MAQQGHGERRIRSYVLRAARMSDAQKRALERLSPRYVVPFSGEPIDWDALFPGLGRRVVEIGFGMGDATRAVAAARPDTAFLGIEVHKPGVGRLLRLIDEDGLDNVRIVRQDAVEVLESMIPPLSVDGFHVWFPDPWPKARHIKRRLINAGTLAMMAACLRPGGYVHCATDWEPYAESIAAAVEAAPGLENPHGKWAPRPDWRPQTKFEGKGRAADRTIRDIIAVKQDREEKKP